MRLLPRKVALLAFLVISLGVFEVEFALANKPNKKDLARTGSVNSIVKLVTKAEARVIELLRERGNNASQILSNRVQAEKSKLSIAATEKKDATSLQWKAILRQLDEASTLFIHGQLNLQSLELSEIRHSSLAAASGATMTSVNNLRLNLSRDAVNRTASSQLQLMAQQIRSSIGNAEQCAVGLSNEVRMLSQAQDRSADQALNFDMNSDPTPFLMALLEAEDNSSFQGLAASYESQKSTQLRGLFHNLAPFAYQNPNSSSLRALIAATEDIKYPNGVLPKIREMIAAYGVRWLAYEEEIQESASLATGALAEVCNNMIQPYLIRMRSLKDPESSSDPLLVARAQMSTAANLLPEVIRQIRLSNQDREVFAAILDRTALSIQNTPSSAPSQLQQLGTTLTLLKNDRIQLSQQARSELSSQTTTESSLAAPVINTLRDLSKMRSDYFEYKQIASFKAEFLDSSMESWLDSESLRLLILPAFWSVVLESRNSKLNEKKIVPLRKCINILMDEVLIEAESERSKSLKSCIARVNKTKSSEGSSLNRELSISLQRIIKGINLTKFMNQFEREVFGSTLEEFAKGVLIGPDDISQES